MRTEEQKRGRPGNEATCNTNSQLPTLPAVTRYTQDSQVKHQVVVHLVRYAVVELHYRVRDTQLHQCGVSGSYFKYRYSIVRERKLLL